MSRMTFLFGLSGLVSVLSIHQASAQVVQLPNHGTFSISGGTSTPDNGTSHLGGLRHTQVGSNRTPMSYGAGGSHSASSANIKTTIIDLDELDRMIRSQTNEKSASTSSAQSTQSSYPNAKINPRHHAAKGKQEAPAPYAYIMAMSHTPVDDPKAIEDARYYLDLAERARKNQQWSNVELFYKIAWQHLPENRRDEAMKGLLAARTKAAEAAAQAEAGRKPNSLPVKTSVPPPSNRRAGF